MYLGNAFGDVLSLGYIDDGEIDRIDEGEVGNFVINTGESATIVPTSAKISGSGPTIDELDENGNIVDDNMDGVANQIPAPEGILLKFDGVQLPTGEVGEAYAFYSGTDSANRTILSCETSSTMILRNSGFADFAHEPFPTGRGSVTAVLSRFFATQQLVLRSTNDVDMTGQRCDPLFEDDFSSNTLDNWTTFSVTGPQVWGTTPFGNPAPSARISGFSGGAVENEDWLISKAIDLSGVTAATLTFETVKRFSGNNLELFMSTDYAGGDPTTDGTWVPLSAGL